MKFKLLTAILATLAASQTYAHSFNCKVSNIANSSGTPNLVYITMACNATNPHSSGTGNCSATTISSNTVVIDGSSEIGKRYYSMTLTALSSQQPIFISAFGTCPTESPSTPLVYSMKLSN